MKQGAVPPRRNYLDANGMHHFDIAVYYEDTDAAGVVYFANYARFMERARQEMMKACGHTYPPFMYVNCKLNFRRPARLDDLLTVRSIVREIGGAKMILDQQVFRASDQELLADMESTVVHVDDNFRPARVPAALCQALKTRQSGESHMTTVNEDRIVLPNGNSICIPAAPTPCSSIMVIAPDGREIGFWNSEDWSAAPEATMKDILKVLFPDQLK